MALRRNKKGGHVRTGLRPSSVHQTPEKRAPLSNARELFPVLRERLLASRPELPAVAHPHWKTSKGKPVMLRHFGAPTFRNVINENGRHV